jgi:hypothetical protein
MVRDKEKVGEFLAKDKFCEMVRDKEKVGEFLAKED